MPHVNWHQLVRNKWLWIGVAVVGGGAVIWWILSRSSSGSSAATSATPGTGNLGQPLTSCTTGQGYGQGGGSSPGSGGGAGGAGALSDATGQQLAADITQLNGTVSGLPAMLAALQLQAQQPTGIGTGFPPMTNGAIIIPSVTSPSPATLAGRTALNRSFQAWMTKNPKGTAQEFAVALHKAAAAKASAGHTMPSGSHATHATPSALAFGGAVGSARFYAPHTASHASAPRAAHALTRTQRVPQARPITSGRRMPTARPPVHTVRQLAVIHNRVP